MNVLESWLSAADPVDIAVVDDSDQLSYGDLLGKSAALAHLYESQYGRRKYLLLPAEKSIAFVIALVAASRSGNIPVPVDPTSPKRLLDNIAERCGDSAIVDLALKAQDGAAPLPDDTEPDLPALVLFTSGTSGSPKGVPVSWQNLEHSVTTVSDYLEYKRYPSAAIVLPLHYSYALLTQLLCMLYVGGRARLFASFRNPIKFAKSVEAEVLQSFCGVPSTYHALCAIHRMSPLHMPAIRVLCSAGAAMDRSLMPEIKDIFPAGRFFDNYGMTEATPRISYLRDDDRRFDEPTCGRAIDGLEVRVLDEQTHRPLRDGEQGIVAIRGPNVFNGYLNDAESTRSAFTDDGFLLSGDYGYLRDQYIYITGRADDIFNVGGEKVSPLEIERALSEHENIVASAVGKVEDENRGTLSVAYIQTNADIRRKEIIDFLEDRLPPARIPLRYIRVRAFPLTPNGKVQRSHLSPDDKSIVIGDIN